jgi:hypothetical protein
MMTFEQAKAALDRMVRHELRDHAFGDTEVDWIFEGSVMACGYFSGTKASVTVYDVDRSSDFEGDEARELRKCGLTGEVSRNDETGPDVYEEGTTMPALTLKGVYEELTEPPH